MGELTTMGELTSLPGQEQNDARAFQAVVSAIDEYFPSTWRTWQVMNYSFQDIFGEDIAQKTDAKLRFALPLDVLAKAFDPSTTSLSERRFRSIKNTILAWPLGRALLYAPHGIMEKIHDPDYSNFVNAVREIKPRLLNRHRASSQLRESAEQRKTSLVSSPSKPSSVESRKRLSTDSPMGVSPPKRAVSANSDALLAEVLTKQTEMFSKLLNMTTEQNENIKKLLDRGDPNTNTADVANESFDSIPDSTNTDDEIDVASCSSTKRSVASTSEKQALEDQIVEAQRKLAALKKGEITETEVTFDFLPFTVEKEPKVLKADAELLKQGISCQRFGQEGWQNVRYSDTQKLFQATPAFSSLKTNNILAGATPSYKSVTILEKVDMTLGAVTNGLLQQRRCFQDLLDKMPQDMRQQVGKEFLAANSNFKKISDNLLQYVCGRRAEAIQQRRESFRPVNRVMRQILHDIPPSESHLFDDKALAEAVKEQGGIHKFFPIRRKQASHTDKPNYDETRKRDIPRTLPSNFTSKKKRYSNDNYAKWNPATKGKNGFSSSARAHAHPSKKKGGDKK